MDTSYHGRVRSEIREMLPPTASRIVDVGCGSGATLAWLRTRYPAAHTIGLEGAADQRNALSRNADEVHILDLNGPLPDLGAPDLMLFMDVLEHLVDPVGTLIRLTRGLAPNGVIIVSLPNVAHLSVSLPLLLRGRFAYEDAGILDRTHLRFFVLETAVELLNEAGFTVDDGLLGIDGSKHMLADKLTMGRLRTRLAKQFVLRGVRSEAGKQAAPVQWRLPSLAKADHSL